MLWLVSASGYIRGCRWPFFMCGPVCGGDDSELQFWKIAPRGNLSPPPHVTRLAGYRQNLNTPAEPDGMSKHTSADPETGAAVVAAAAVPAPSALADSANAVTASERIILEFIFSSSIVRLLHPRFGTSQ